MVLTLKNPLREAEAEMGTFSSCFLRVFLKYAGKSILAQIISWFSSWRGRKEGVGLPSPGAFVTVPPSGQEITAFESLFITREQPGQRREPASLL